MALLHPGWRVNHRPHILALSNPQIANMIVMVIHIGINRLDMQIIMPGRLTPVALTPAQPYSLLEQRPLTAPDPHCLPALRLFIFPKTPGRASLTSSLLIHLSCSFSQHASHVRSALNLPSYSER